MFLHGTIKVIEDSGAFGPALWGALIGASAGLGAAWIVGRSNRSIDRERRIFDARRTSHEKALGIYTFAFGKRIRNNEKYPIGGSKEDKELTDILAAASLFSSKELIEHMRSFFAFLDENMPTVHLERSGHIVHGNILWQKMVLEMRKELGMGEFLKEPIPDLPTEEEIKG